jgi:hypothetical protein
LCNIWTPTLRTTSDYDLYWNDSQVFSLANTCVPRLWSTFPELDCWTLLCLIFLLRYIIFVGQRIVLLWLWAPTQVFELQSAILLSSKTKRWRDLVYSGVHFPTITTDNRYECASKKARLWTGQ